MLANWTHYPSEWQDVKRFELRQQYIEEYLVRKAQHPTKVLGWRRIQERTRWLVFMWCPNTTNPSEQTNHVRLRAGPTKTVIRVNVHPEPTMPPRLNRAKRQPTSALPVVSHENAQMCHLLRSPVEVLVDILSSTRSTGYSRSLAHIFAGCSAILVLPSCSNVHG